MTNNIGSQFGAFGFKFSSILNVHDNFVPSEKRELLRQAGYKVVKVKDKTFLKINPKEIQYKSLEEPIKNAVKLLKEVIQVAQTVNGFVLWFGNYDGAANIVYTTTLDKAIEVAQAWQEKKGGKARFLYIIDGRRAGHGSDWDAKIEIHEASEPEEEIEEENVP